jgi:hypothetical protein
MLTFVLPTLNAAALFESTSIERCGPPITVIFELPAAVSAPTAVGCSITSGIGVDNGVRPQVAEAATLTVCAEETTLEKYVATGSVTVTLI